MPREAVIVFDLVGDTQEAASGMARAAYHVALHWPVKEWKAGSITTFAHPYSAPVVDRGPGVPVHAQPSVGDRRRRARPGLPHHHARSGAAMTDLANATRHFSLIRSKDAGSVHADARSVLLRRATPGGPSPQRGCSPPSASGSCTASTRRQVQIFELADIDALKISFPRPVASGEFGDTDITGGQQYALLVEMISELEIDGDGANLVVRDPGRG